MEPDFADALEIVLNAITECQNHLSAGDLAKARVELTDPLFVKAFEEVRFHKDELVNKTARSPGKVA